MPITTITDFAYGGKDPEAYALDSRYGAVGLRADDGFITLDEMRIHSEMLISLPDIYKTEGPEKVLETLKKSQRKFYIHPTTKPAELACEYHLGANKLIQRKPMICMFRGGEVFLHKELAESLLAKNVLPGYGELTPITLETVDGSFVNNDYYWLKTPVFLNEEKWVTGHQIYDYHIGNPNNFKWEYKYVYYAGVTMPVTALVDTLPPGDFWQGEHLRDIYLFVMSPRAKAIIDQHQSPYKKYKLRLWAQIYTKLEDTPLVPTFFNRNHVVAEITGHSRPLNEGETLPPEFEIGEVYKFHITNDKQKYTIESLGKDPRHPSQVGAEERELAHRLQQRAILEKAKKEREEKEKTHKKSRPRAAFFMLTQ